ncbi:hypothetical protein ABPG72_001691 [Tetrahymena utriculariae]
MKQSGQKYAYSQMETAKVNGVNFSILSEKEIESWCVCEIKNFENGNKEDEGFINDKRLGTTSKDVCKTCNQKNECPGHFGYINLKRPIFHINFINTVKQILLCVCHKCGAVREPPIKRNESGDPANKTELAKLEKYLEVMNITQPKRRLNELYKILGKQSKCQNDKCNSYLFVKVSVVKFLILKVAEKQNDKESIEYDLSAEQALEILKKIKYADSKKLLAYKGQRKHDDDFLSPTNLILTKLLVPPPQVRPSIEMSSNMTCQDELTKCYEEVLKLNAQIKDNSDNRKLVEQIQSVVARMMDNDKPRLEALKIKSKVVKSFSQRLKGKEGRFRQNLMGKRVDFSARSVISPDANLWLDELGVPRSIADSLTVPEIVNQQNINRIRELWKQGKIKSIMKPNREKQIYEAYDAIICSGDRQADDNFDMHVNDGVIIERALQNGDFVLFNRQPSLHKMSMMGHKVRILPYSTFRLNLSVTTPYNADFDGDEMNMHVPQTYETRVELGYICHVPRQIVTPKANKPVMGLVQDSLLGVAMFTLRDKFLTREQVMNLVMWIDNWEGDLPMPAILKPEPLWTGKQIMSLVIPEQMTMTRFKGDKEDDKWFHKQDESIYIYKGELIQGYMNKAIVGDGPGGLVHLIWLDIGHEETKNFMTRCQRVVNNWLIMFGHTISCADIVPSEKCQEEIEKIRKKAFEKYDKIELDFQDAVYIDSNNMHKAGKKIFDSFEVQVNSILNELRQESEKQAEATIKFKYNQFNKMVWSGSKGKATNLAQVMGLVGQQNIEGARIRNGFSRRTLPHFCKDDNGIIARGFVVNNFYIGLKPYEFFFHTMGGREGLSDTAVKTSRTGYIQRKLVKALEDVIVRYDGTVRDSQGMIIQTCYGEDSLAGEYIETQKINEVDYKEEDFQKEYRFVKSNKSDDWLFQYTKLDQMENQISKEISRDVLIAIKEEFMHMINERNEGEDPKFILEQEYEELIEARNLFRKNFYFYAQESKLDINLPVNIGRMIESAKIEMSQKNKTYTRDQCKTNPIQVYKSLLELFKNLDEYAVKRGMEQESLALFKAHIRLHLGSKKIVLKHKLSMDVFDKLTKEIFDKFKKAISHPGETIGAISAQSVGEPTTQMTLNTFHFAGVSDRNVTLGVPRLQEILDASKNVKTPEMTIFFENGLRRKIFKKEMMSNYDADSFKREYDEIVSQERQEILRLKQEIEYQTISYYINQTRIVYKSKEDEDFQQDDIFGDDNTADDLDPIVLIIYFDTLKATLDTFDLLSEKIKKIAEDSKKWGNLIVEKKSEKGQIHVKFDSTSQSQAQPNPESSINAYSSLLLFESEFKDAYIGGIQKIQKVYPTQKKEFRPWVENECIYAAPKAGGAFFQERKPQEHIFNTSGSNLKEVLKVDKVDYSRTYSNDIQEIISILGIEAGRRSIVNQIRVVIEPYGIYINYRHLAILAEWMTIRGRLTPINRNGINRIPGLSCLRKSSFEETVDILNTAAIFFEKDDLKGVTENIIFGQNCDIGTGCFDLLVDLNKVGEFKTKRDIDPRPSGIEEYSDNESSRYENTPSHFQTPGPGLVSAYPNSMRSVQHPGSFTPTTPYQNSPAYVQTPITYSNTYNPTRSTQYSPQTGNNSPFVPSPNYSPPSHTPAGSTSPANASPYTISPQYKSSSLSGAHSPSYTSPSQVRYNSPSYQNPHASSSSPLDRSKSTYMGSQQSPQYMSSPHYEQRTTPMTRNIKSDTSYNPTEERESEESDSDQD